MTDETIGVALGRLEAALARAERAAMSLPRVSRGDDRLSVRHDLLRARTQEAIDALDRLIESG